MGWHLAVSGFETAQINNSTSARAPSTGTLVDLCHCRKEPKERRRKLCAKVHTTFLNPFSSDLMKKGAFFFNWFCFISTFLWGLFVYYLFKYLIYFAGTSPNQNFVKKPEVQDLGLSSSAGMDGATASKSELVSPLMWYSCLLPLLATLL